MKVTVVYDNCTSKPALKTAWGFSCLIEAESEPPLLFDTGADGATLLYNMEQLNIDPERIGKVILSHGHGDHTGGLAAILERNRHADIYIPASLMLRLSERKVVSVSQPTWITKSVFSTGELKGIEQSLAVKTDKGLVVIVACSHPGVGVILDRVSQQGQLYGIIGGLHHCHDFKLLQGLSLICPCHCTQYKYELKELFPKQHVLCGAGLVIEI
jgi:7,8-dihydropterin-6-yl-methyl-4-(beta-D-ribofuranosyl)aminobenzene 5'-phosphate synthase